jgi:hypothetical protein
VTRITPGECEPLPKIGVTTDATDWSRLADARLRTTYAGRVLVDAPGWDTERHPVESFVRHFPFHRFETVVLVVSGKLRGADETGHRAIKGCPTRCLVARTNAETLDAAERRASASDIEKVFGAIPTFFVSNRTNEGIAELRAALDLPAGGGAAS